jgi:hypothetical protein
MVALTAAFVVQMSGRVLAATAQDVQRGMQLLKSKATALGTPSIKGESQVAGQTAPVLYFGQAQINNNFTLVDEIKTQMGMGGTATFFVKSGDEFVRVSTNVKKADGSRAIGTILDPKGKVIVAIKQGKSYFGVANILGKEYLTGYEPIRDASNNIIGIYYVGYLK